MKRNLSRPVWATVAAGAALALAIPVAAWATEATDDATPGQEEVANGPSLPANPTEPGDPADPGDPVTPVHPQEPAGPITLTVDGTAGKDSVTWEDTFTVVAKTTGLPTDTGLNLKVVKSPLVGGKPSESYVGIATTNAEGVATWPGLKYEPGVYTFTATSLKGKPGNTIKSNSLAVTVKAHQIDLHLTDTKGVAGETTTLAGAFTSETAQSEPVGCLYLEENLEENQSTEERDAMGWYAPVGDDSLDCTPTGIELGKVEPAHTRAAGQWGQLPFELELAIPSQVETGQFVISGAFVPADHDRYTSGADNFTLEVTPDKTPTVPPSATPPAPGPSSPAVVPPASGTPSATVPPKAQGKLPFTGSNAGLMGGLAGLLLSAGGGLTWYRRRVLS